MQDMSRWSTDIIHWFCKWRRLCRWAL